MKKSIAVIICALSATSASAAELSSTITFTNDYRFNGISQTDGDPALQGSMDLAFDNGFYAGIWGSNVDFGDDANLEIDYYGGYYGELTEDLAYDFTVGYYTYPGYDAFDGDYYDAAAAIIYKGVSLKYVYADDYFNSGESGQYVTLDYSYPVNETVALDFHAGHSFGDYWGRADIDDYEDYSVGVSAAVMGLDLSAKWLFNDIDSEDEISSGVFRNDDTLLVSVSRTF